MFLVSPKIGKPIPDEGKSEPECFDDCQKDQSFSCAKYYLHASDTVAINSP
jgi:hypothetical protein